MNYCVDIPMGLWLFLGLLGALSGLVMAGTAFVAVMERRERIKADHKRKVFVSCAVRVGPRLELPTRAANDSHLRS